MLKNQKLPRILKVAENLKICQKVAKQVTKHAVRPFPFHLAMNFEVSTKLFRPAVRVRFPTVYPIGPIQMYFNKKIVCRHRMRSKGGQEQKKISLETCANCNSFPVASYFSLAVIIS